VVPLCDQLDSRYNTAMNMLPTKQIEEIATRVAQANLTPQVAHRVLSEAIVDSEGQDALRLTLVIAPESVETIDGRQLLDNLVETQRELQQAGEERYAFLSYTTEEELADGGDQP
jgi:cellobiose-specific phosphotransferase system component IIA